MQKNFSQIAFVKKKGKIKGIITLKDILSVLVGKISDEREKYLGEENISN